MLQSVPRIYDNSPSLDFCLPPYFTHDASCIMLNIDWTPLFVSKSVNQSVNHSVCVCVLQAVNCVLLRLLYVSRKSSQHLRHFSVTRFFCRCRYHVINQQYMNE